MGGAFKLLVLAGALLVCSACNNMGCAELDGLKVVSKSTFAAAGGANAFYKDQSDQANSTSANPDGFGWTVRRDAKESSDPDYPKYICVPASFVVP